MSTASKAHEEGPMFLAELFGNNFHEAPYERYQRLHAKAPSIALPEIQAHVFYRYGDCQKLLRDKRLGHDYPRRMKALHGEDVFEKNAVYRNLSHSMLLMDEPGHGRIRGLVTKAFDARRTEALRPEVARLSQALIDGFEGDGGGDLIPRFTFPLPVLVICEMLGIPEEDRDRFVHGERISGRVIDPTPMTPEELAETNAGSENSAAYFNDLLDRRRRSPKDDLLSALVAAETQDGKLTGAELVANVSLLFAAGHETTVNLLGNGLRALWQHRPCLDALRADLTLLPAAVEEMLRFDSSVQLTGRRALEDFTFQGHDIKEGDNVITLLGAANHDGETFPEPERFRLDRKAPRALSFGGGIHYCLGAQLSRIEGEEALRALFERLPKLELDPSVLEAPEQKPTITLRGLGALPACWA